MNGWKEKEQTPFMVIHDLSKIFHGRLRQLAEESGLNESYRHILFHLSHQDGVTQLALAEMTRLKPPTISVTLQKMQEEGYVERKRDEEDLRNTRVFMTEKGRAFNEEAKSLVESLDSAAIAGFDETEKQQLMAMLFRIRDNLVPKEWAYAKKQRHWPHTHQGGME
ncbi:MAG: winged helix-turn-helix transcriptional regulator [Clostridiales bacterium]|nr:winged helix-turn-helix transcriptional regulator [Clostridiales bacterium]